MGNVGQNMDLEEKGKASMKKLAMEIHKYEAKSIPANQSARFARND